MMSKSWRYKIYFVLFCVLFSTYYLVPTFLNFKGQRENFEKQKVDAPWYFDFFPNDQINLGLDLQGGIYLELEVLFQDALFHQAYSTANAVVRYLEEQKIKDAHVQQVPKTTYIRVEARDENELKLASAFLNSNYQEAFRKIANKPELVFSFHEAENASKSYQEIYGWASKNLGVLDAQLEKEKLYLVFPPETDLESSKTKIMEQFSSLLKEEVSFYLVYYHLTDSYKATLKSQTISQAIETIRNRIDRYGVTEPAISKVGENRVSVELPGETNPGRALQVILQAGKLEFRLVRSKLSQQEKGDELSDDEVKELVATVRAEYHLPDDYSQETTDLINKALKGKIPDDQEILFELKRDEHNQKIQGGVPYLVDKRADVTGEMLQSAQVNVQDNKPFVSLSFKPVGKKIFGELTEKNVNKRLAILLDGYVTSAPNINEAIYGGDAQITLGAGSYQTVLKEAQDLVVVLKEGALPASLKEATKTVIGPSLGKSSIQKGTFAVLLAGLVIIVFMLFYYRLSGLYADISLMFNVLFILFTLSMFGATLTLPGVAGIILTLGMAVDANIIIFERIREEILEGKRYSIAVDQGFGHAMSAIVDANITTFCSALVLYQFGTGPVRGFAVTLMIGIVTTMFTAIFVTRLFMDFAVRKRDLKKLSI